MGEMIQNAATAGSRYPEWVNQFSRKYRSGSVSQYVFHGNIYDLIRVRDEQGKASYHILRDFLSAELFRKADLVVFYDRSSGIRFRTPEMRKDFVLSLTAYDTLYGTKFATSIPRDPITAFTLLEMHFRKRLMDNPQYAIAFIIEYAETIIPMADAAHYNPEDRAIQVFLQRWANEGVFRKNDIIFALLTEKIINLNGQYVKNPNTYEITLPYPEESDRMEFIRHFLGNYSGPRHGKEPAQHFEMTAEVLAKNTAGLTLAHLRILMAEVIENNYVFTYDALTAKKKEIIESEGAGLLEFVKTRFSLADVAGHKYAKKHLMHTAHAIKSGRSDVVPMGYLVSGPVGTGKTFLITCFANDIGVPMVILKNFRSKWQGETEGNLEKVLGLLQAMSPVAVMIDEADAYLGDRNQEGDSGVGSRVFSMIASFMSNTANRGRIIWFLVTARPDLMPVDFKRQGRAEEHIALFYPETPEEKKELFETMLRKTDLEYLSPEQMGEAFFQNLKINSGAEMEAALTRAKFRAAAQNAEKVTPEILQEAIEDFLPPTYPEEIELMNYAAVLECTSKDLLPEKYKKMGRDEVVERVRMLRMRIAD